MIRTRSRKKSLHRLPTDQAEDKAGIPSLSCPSLLLFSYPYSLLLCLLPFFFSFFCLFVYPFFQQFNRIVSILLRSSFHTLCWHCIILLSHHTQYIQYDFLSLSLSLSLYQTAPYYQPITFDDTIIIRSLM